MPASRQSRFSEALTQAMVAEFLASPAYARHLRRLRQALHAAREHAAERVATHFPAGTRLSVPSGGTLLWLQLPDEMSGDALFETALAEDEGFRLHRCVLRRAVRNFRVCLPASPGRKIHDGRRRFTQLHGGTVRVSTSPR